MGRLFLAVVLLAWTGANGPWGTAAALTEQYGFGACADPFSDNARDWTACATEAAAYYGQWPTAGAAAPCPPGYAWPYHYQTGPSENKWTPLYGVNSPYHGHATSTVEASDAREEAVEVHVQYRFGSATGGMARTGTTFAGEGIKAENGESAMVYRLIEWTKYTLTRCRDGAQWDLFRPTNHSPGGSASFQLKHLTGNSATTDQDNDFYPSAWGANDAIHIDMRFNAADEIRCTSKQWIWFGQSNVVRTGVGMTFGGVWESGAIHVKTKTNTWHYYFEDGCYEIDYFGGEDGKRGAAFRYTGPHDPSGGHCVDPDVLDVTGVESDHSALEGTSILGVGLPADRCCDDENDCCEEEDCCEKVLRELTTACCLDDPEECEDDPQDPCNWFSVEWMASQCEEPDPDEPCPSGMADCLEEPCSSFVLQCGADHPCDAFDGDTAESCNDPDATVDPEGDHCDSVGWSTETDPCEDPAREPPNPCLVEPPPSWCDD